MPYNNVTLHPLVSVVDMSKADQFNPLVCYDNVFMNMFKSDCI